jgi:hypothetical protein
MLRPSVFDLGLSVFDLERLNELKALMMSGPVSEALIKEFESLTVAVAKEREKFAFEWDNSSLD